MASITLRSVKGSPLTNNEVDDNFSNLNTELGVTVKSVNGTTPDGSGNVTVAAGSGTDPAGTAVAMAIALG
jgi:hypothetical protein